MIIVYESRYKPLLTKICRMDNNYVLLNSRTYSITTVKLFNDCGIIPCIEYSNSKRTKNGKVCGLIEDDNYLSNQTLYMMPKEFKHHNLITMSNARLSALISSKKKLDKFISFNLHLWKEVIDELFKDETATTKVLFKVDGADYTIASLVYDKVANDFNLSIEFNKLEVDNYQNKKNTFAYVIDKFKSYIVDNYSVVLSINSNSFSCKHIIYDGMYFECCAPTIFDLYNYLMNFFRGYYN